MITGLRPKRTLGTAANPFTVRCAGTGWWLSSQMLLICPVLQETMPTKVLRGREARGKLCIFRKHFLNHSNHSPSKNTTGQILQKALVKSGNSVYSSKMMVCWVPTQCQATGSYCISRMI